MLVPTRRKRAGHRLYAGAVRYPRCRRDGQTGIGDQGTSEALANIVSALRSAKGDARVKSYCINILDREGDVFISHFIWCRDDLDALRTAEEQSINGTVEVWHGGRFVARVKAGNLPLDVRDRESL